MCFAEILIRAPTKTMQKEIHDQACKPRLLLKELNIFDVFLMTGFLIFSRCFRWFHGIFVVDKPGCVLHMCRSSLCSLCASVPIIHDKAVLERVHLAAVFSPGNQSVRSSCA